MLQNLLVRRLQYNQQARRFFFTIVALGFAVDGVYAVLLNLYLLRLGYDTSFIGQVNAVGLMAFALTSLPAGILGARLSSTLMMRLGFGSLLIGTVGLPFVEFIPSGLQSIWLMATYAFILAGFSLFFVQGAPFLLSTVAEERKNSAFAMMTALLASAAFVGSLVGGNVPSLFVWLGNFTLNDPEPYRYTLMLVMVVVLAAFVITFTLIEPENQDDETPSDTPQKPKRKRGNFTRSVIRLVFVMSLIRFLQVAGVATISIFFNVYMDTQLAMPPNIIGAVASVGRILAVPMVLLSPRLMRRFGVSSVALWASFATAICILPIALVPFWGVASFGYVATLVSTNIRFAAFVVYIMSLVPKHQQNVMAGAGEAGAGLSFALMAFGGGYIATIFSFRELFLLGAILTGVGTLVYWLHMRQHGSGEIAISQASH